MSLNMDNRPGLKTLACCVAAVLAQWAAGTASADSTVGVDTTSGNFLNPYPDPTRPLDLSWPAGKHTPYSQLYSVPFEPPAEPRTSATGWEYSGQVEFGGLAGDADEENALFRMYKDPDNGFYLNNFSFSAEKADTARFFEIAGGGVGNDDQFYGVQFGRYNDWKVKAFYSETPHTFTHTFGTLWSGIGTGELTLLPPLTPGGSGLGNAVDNANAAAVINARNMTLSVTREKGGVRYDVNLSNSWKGYASYTLEAREGARPFAATWAGGGGRAPMEIAEPVDFSTADWLAGVRYSRGLNAFNLQLSASLFRNDNDTLTFEEPFRLFDVVTNGIAPGGFTRGVVDLHPDNEAYRVKAEYARSLPGFYDGRFTALVSWATSRQDDKLLPYTSLTGVTLANVTGNNWNTTDSLSRTSADAQIDTGLVDLGLMLAPTDALNIKGKFRYFQTDNKMDPFLVCNPNASYVDNDPNTADAQPGGLTHDGCTGVWGRVLNDGTGSSVLMGASSARAGNLPISSIPFEYKQYNAGLSADYRFGASSLNFEYEREAYNREHRERDETNEDKFKLSYVNRGLPDSTLQLSYEYGDRGGDRYVTAATEEFVSAELVPIPTGPAGTSVSSWAVHMNSGLRKYDLSDREQHIVNARINTMLRPNLDAGVSLQFKQIDYSDATYGRDEHDQVSANLDLNYQPSASQMIYGYYSSQRSRMHQNGNSSSGTCNLGQVTALGTITPANAHEICPAPGGPLFPFINGWTATGKDRNHVFGLGLKQDFGRVGLDINYVHLESRSELGYTYTPGGAVSVANAPFAGNGMPDMVFYQNVFDMSLLIPVSDQATVRLLYRHEYGKVRDWHYQGIEGTPVVVAPPGTAVPTAIILDGGPEDYDTNMFGILLQLKL